MGRPLASVALAVALGCPPVALDSAPAAAPRAAAHPAADPAVGSDVPATPWYPVPFLPVDSWNPYG